MKEVLLRTDLYNLLYGRDTDHKEWVTFYTDGTFKYDNGYFELCAAPFRSYDLHRWEIVNNDFVKFRKPDISTRTGWQPYYFTSDPNLMLKLCKMLNDAAMEKEFELLTKEEVCG